MQVLEGLNNGKILGKFKVKTIQMMINCNNKQTMTMNIYGKMFIVWRKMVFSY